MKLGTFLRCAAPAVATCLLLARGASADELNPGAGDAGQITAVNPGVTELSLENIFVLGYDESGDAKAFRMTLLVGPTLRYFITRNGVLGFNVSLLYKATDGQTSASDLGGVVSTHLGYLLNISGGMFFKPIVGVGGFFGRREVEVPIGGTPTVVTSQIYGAVLRAGLDMVFYSSSRFNLFAGPEAILSLGTSSTENVAGTTVEGQFFMSIDGGFNVGLSYVF